MNYNEYSSHTPDRRHGRRHGRRTQRDRRGGRGPPAPITQGEERLYQKLCQIEEQLRMMAHRQAQLVREVREGTKSVKYTLGRSPSSGGALRSQNPLYQLSMADVGQPSPLRDHKGDEYDPANSVYYPTSPVYAPESPTPAARNT